MGSDPDADELEATLAEVAERLEADLRELFGHEDATARLEDGTPRRAVLEGEAGSFALSWPPEDGLTDAEGRLGAHATIGLELLLAAETPGAFFEGFRPQRDERRERLFDHLEDYIDDSLRENPYYTPLTVVRRGAAMLVYADDEYTLVAEDGTYRGSGLLHWKVKRLVAFALTDVDQELLSEDEAGETGPERWTRA
jgi:hypothetical protein